MAKLAHWLKDAPSWFDTLYDALEADARWEWLSQTRSLETAAEIRSEYDPEDPKASPWGYAIAPVIKELCAGFLSDIVPLAEGPIRKDIAPLGVEYAGWLLWDRARPEQLFWALEPCQPAIFWVPVGTTVDSVDAALSPYFPDTRPLRLELDKTVRGFGGTPDMIGSDIYELENHYVTSTSTIGRFWGSEYLDDPWPEEIEVGTNHLVMINLQRDYMTQRPGRGYSASFRTTWSQSIITIEDHDPLLVIQVRYKPVEPTVSARLLDVFDDLTYPADAPADVLGALLGMHFETAGALRLAIENPDEAVNRCFNLHALGAVEQGDLRLADDLRAFMRSEEVDERIAAAQVAERLGMDFLLREQFAIERDPELSAGLRGVCGYVEEVTHG